MLDHKPIIFSILVLLAYFFHNSALFMYIWLPLSLIRKWKIRYSILIVTGLLFYFTLSMLMSYLVGSSLFKDDIAEKYMNSGVNTSKTMIVISISFLLYGVFLLTHNRFKNSTLLFLYVSSSTLSLIVIFMAYYIEVAFRVALYMIIASMILTLYHIQINKKSSWVLLSIYISLFLLDFYISCSHGLYGALDYSSKILGI